MSHVDDGALHAFLDGALEALPPEEATRIRDHLAVCPSCAERLEEERSVREEASRILAGSTPALDGLPTFEELRAQAAARKPLGGAQPWGRRQKMAWAASVVLALGAGWMLRQATGPAGRLQRALEGSRPPEAASVPSPELDRARQVSADRESGEGNVVALPTGPRAQTGAPELLGRVATEPVVEQELGSDARAERADLPAEAKATVLPEEHRRSADVAAVPPIFRTDSVGGRPSRAIVLKDSLGGATDDRAATEVRRTLAQESARQTRSAAADQVASPASPAAQPASGAEPSREIDPTGSLVVPGLVVLSVSWLDERGLAGVVRVRQLLEGGDTLELLHLPPGMDPSGLGATVSDGLTELVVRREGGWLVARAPITGDALTTLVDRLLAPR